VCSLRTERCSAFDDLRRRLCKGLDDARCSMINERSDVEVTGLAGSDYSSSIILPVPECLLSVLQNMPGLGFASANGLLQGKAVRPEGPQQGLLQDFAAGVPGCG
jgi:hypothetical protein